MNDQPPGDTPKEPEPPLNLQGTELDWFLQDLVRLVSENEVTFGVTLVVRGAIVTGQLCSAAAFHDNFANTFADSWPGDDEGKETLRSAFSKNAEIARDAAKDEDAFYAFIHLRNAYFLTPGGDQTTPTSKHEGLWWRGRICDVSGFSLGSISYS